MEKSCHMPKIEGNYENKMLSRGPLKAQNLKPTLYVKKERIGKWQESCLRYTGTK